MYVRSTDRGSKMRQACFFFFFFETHEPKMGSGPPVGRHSEAAKNVFYGVEGRSYVATRISFSMLLLPRSVFFFPKRRCVAPLQLSRVWRSIFGMSDLDTKQPIRV